MPEPVPPAANESPAGDGYEWDPTFLNCRREALVALAVWFAAFCWTVPYCYLNGYPNLANGDFDPETMTTVLGIPSWTFWGVFAPWLVCLGVTFWFTLVFMRDDHLGTAPEDEEEGE